MFKQNPEKLHNIHRRVAKGAEKRISFLIAAETSRQGGMTGRILLNICRPPAIENHHAFGNLKTPYLCLQKCRFFLFALSAKRKKPTLVVLCVLCALNERSEWAVKAEDLF